MSAFQNKAQAGVLASGAASATTSTKELSLSHPSAGSPIQGTSGTLSTLAAEVAAKTAAAGVLAHWTEPGGNSAKKVAVSAPLSPRDKFQQQYDQTKGSPLTTDAQARARWRELSPMEVMAMTGTEVGQDPKPVAPKAGEFGYTTTVNGRTYRYDQVKEDPNKPTSVADLMGPQSSQFNSRAFVTERAKQNPNNSEERAHRDVLVLNNDGTTSTLSQNDHDMVELPSSGFGYSTYNRNDVKFKGRDEHQKDQWGDPESIAKFINIANDYHTLRPDQNIEYGDIATDDNMSPLLYDNNSKTRHASHGQGNQVDLRYPKDDFGTNSLIRSAEDWGVNNFYFNPAKQNKYFFGNDSNATPDADHADHLHMGFGQGGRE